MIFLKLIYPQMAELERGCVQSTSRSTSDCTTVSEFAARCGWSFRHSRAPVPKTSLLGIQKHSVLWSLRLITAVKKFRRQFSKPSL
jgi:hypothetical protein